MCFDIVPTTMYSSFALPLMMLVIQLCLDATCKVMHVHKRSIQNEVLSRHDIEEADTKFENKFQQNSQLHRWTQAAYQFIQSLDCAQTPLTTEKECRRVLNRKQSQIGVYLAEPSIEGFYSITLPDDLDTSRSGRRHDAVLVLDPFSGADFGHLLIMFYVDLFVDPSHCHQKQGLSLAESECLTLVVKERCKNSLERRTRRRNFRKRCEINFLPLAYIDTSAIGTTHVGPKQQMLRCRSDEVPGFASCPRRAASNETSEMFCDPLRDNTKRCELEDYRIHTSCRVMEMCDQGVIISGGWNRDTLTPTHERNVHDMYSVLRRNGFKRRNVKVFYANGMRDGIQVSGERVHDVFPAAMKYAMRSHVQKLCRESYCVDTLVLYLNGPAKSDGTILLWDTNADGIANPTERYTLSELLSDLASCEARRVHLIVDQSYAGEVARSFRRSTAHGRVTVYAASKDTGYTVGGEYTRAWVNSNHTEMCMKNIHKTIKRTMESSSPEIAEAPDVTPSTIFGAPCDVIPPFSERELRHKYLGCQNLPTALWMRKLTNSALSSTTDISSSRSRESNHMAAG